VTDRPAAPAQPRTAPPRTAFLLAQLGADAADRFAERVAALGLTPRDAGAIRVLGRSPGISQRELATRLGTTPSRIVPLLDSLEQRGLVERTRSERDRRNYELALTETGQALLAPLRTIAEAHQRAVLGALSAEEQVQLAALLSKLSAGGGLLPDAHPGYARQPGDSSPAPAPAATPTS
jgi:DNA-binding MarR family transcriptional regulator